MVWFPVVFSFFWDTLSSFFSSCPLVWWCPLPLLPRILKFPFLRVFWHFLGLVVLFFPSWVVSRFSLLHGKFFCGKFYLSVWTIFSLSVLRFPRLFIFIRQFDVVHVHYVIYLFLRLSFYPAVHFLSMWLSGIVAITNSNDDRAFPWNIPHWIFFTPKPFLPAFSSILQLSMVSR